ncbi:hypothetical protein JK358_20855 [Nocardia sp. 2]|uniref:Uncharacterized protein n=1 Tax=Nocardia acididurans TaxID=2802282 RepID=A0ABS1M886_9NOCA|nr:hypothetical protein [Nocardia acididurans]MBL1076850.1 hypothetical protein [Nocardia acididurans]
MADVWRIVRGLGLAIALAFLFELGFLVWTGPHPDCAINDSVGPCGLWDTVRTYAVLLLGFAMLMGVTAWATWILATWAVRRIVATGQKNPSFLGE